MVPTIYLISTIAFLITLAYIIIGRIKSELISDDKPTKNLISINISDNKPDILEHSLKKYGGIIALFTALAFYGLVYILFLKDFYEWIKDYQQQNSYSIAGFLIFSFLLGNGSALGVFSGLSSDNSNGLWSTNDKNLLIQRSNNIVTWYLCFIFFALFFAFWAEFDFEYNIVKGLVLAFLFGCGFYFIFRKKINTKGIINLLKKVKK